MPGVDGLAATELLRARPDPPEVIVLTTFDADEHVLRALRAGASGFLLKDTPPARDPAGDPRGRGRRTDPVARGDPPAHRPRRRHRRGRPPAARPRAAGPAQRARTEVAVAVGRGQSNAEIAASCS